MFLKELGMIIHLTKNVKNTKEKFIHPLLT